MKLGSSFELGVAAVSIADVMDYSESLFGTRNESIIMIAIPMIFAVLSYVIYAKCYFIMSRQRNSTFTIIPSVIS